jgi:hypothetical protein
MGLVLANGLQACDLSRNFNYAHTYTYSCVFPLELLFSMRRICPRYCWGKGGWETPGRVSRTCSQRPSPAKPGRSLAVQPAMCESETPACLNHLPLEVWHTELFQQQLVKWNASSQSSYFFVLFFCLFPPPGCKSHESRSHVCVFPALSPEPRAHSNSSVNSCGMDGSS